MAGKFTDKKGNEWTLTLDVGTLMRLETDADFDIDSIRKKPEESATILFADPRALGKILWVMCEEEAKARGLDGRSFASLLDGDTLDQAVRAFYEVAIPFFHRSGLGRALKGRVSEMLAKVDAEMERKGTEAVDRVLASSGTAGDSPASSESIPAG